MKGQASDIVSIPQAVSTVATDTFNAILENNVSVSIPQAVSTVATLLESDTLKKKTMSFNTASGKYCCNHLAVSEKLKKKVSIPQAVSTVATA